MNCLYEEICRDDKMIFKEIATNNMKKEIYLNRFRHTCNYRYSASKTGMTRRDDLRLAERVLSGEEKALREFVGRFEKKIINFFK